MYSPDRTAIRLCPRLGCAVDMRATEGRCRDRHGCESGTCPLAPDFARPRPLPLSRMLASALAMWAQAAG